VLGRRGDAAIKATSEEISMVKRNYMSLKKRYRRSDVEGSVIKWWKTKFPSGKFQNGGRVHVSTRKTL